MPTPAPWCGRLRTASRSRANWILPPGKPSAAGAAPDVSESGFLLAEDEVEELPPEVRGGADVAAFDLDVIQGLEPEDVAACGVGLGDDPAEEHPQFPQPGSGARGGRVGEWKVHVDAVHAVQAQLPQPLSDQLSKVRPRLLDPHEGQVVVPTHIDAHSRRRRWPGFPAALDLPPQP